MKNDDDPIEALGKLGRDKLKGKTIRELRDEAREAIYEKFGFKFIGLRKD